MATHPRDGAPEEPVGLAGKSQDKRWPLAEVFFNGPTRIPGTTTMMTTLEAGANRLVDGKEWAPPDLWYDPVNRLVYVGEYSYGMERVHCFRRAKLKITRKPPSLNLEKYKIGK